MNTRQKSKLQIELRAVGASETEIGKLVSIANELGVLKNNHSAKRTQHSKHRHLALAVGIPSLCGLALGIFLVIASQTVLPGSLLYPAQRLSDNIAILVEPSYRETVMMKQANQVRELVTNRAPSSRVLATLADYRQQAASYQSVNSNYAAFEYCKHRLEQAASIAPSPERQAINSTLQSLNDV
jgi:hypothetical protein